MGLLLPCNNPTIDNGVVVVVVDDDDNNNNDAIVDVNSATAKMNKNKIVQ